MCGRCENHDSQVARRCAVQWAFIGTYLISALDFAGRWECWPIGADRCDGENPSLSPSPIRGNGAPSVDRSAPKSGQPFVAIKNAISNEAAL